MGGWRIGFRDCETCLNLNKLQYPDILLKLHSRYSYEGDFHSLEKLIALLKIHGLIQWNVLLENIP